MENKKQNILQKWESSDNSSSKNNISNKDENESTNKAYLTNEEYIKLFYNSKNNGVNKNFPLNVIHNLKKEKNGK